MNYSYTILNDTNINSLRRVIRDLKLIVGEKGKTVTVQKLKQVKSTRFKAVNEQGEYHVSGTIKFRVMNVTISGSNVSSDLRSKPFSFITPKMQKSKITSDYIETGAEESLVALELESGDIVDVDLLSDVRIIPIAKTVLSSHKMGQQKFSYKILEKADSININPGECAIDYIMYELAGKPGFKSLTRAGLITFFHGKQMSTDQIIEFAKQYNTVSVYAVDPLQKVFKYHAAEDKRYSLCFLINNSHLYPILDSNTKKSISLTKQISLSDYKFASVYNEIQYIKDYDKETIDTKSR
jgi:hypothetical protein